MNTTKTANPSLIKEGDYWNDLTPEQLKEVGWSFSDYMDIPVRDRETFVICGMKRADYDKMIHDHQRDNELAADYHIASGGWRKQYEEWCIDLLKEALARHGTQYLIEFNDSHNTENLLFNFFEEAKQ